MKKSLPILAAFGLICAVPVHAQNEMSNFSATGRGGVVTTFAKDYQVLGINPANLGRSDNSLVSFGFAEVGIGLSSQSLTKSDLSNFIFNTEENLTQEQKRQFATAFANSNALNMNSDITTVGISVSLEKIGGFAVSHRSRTLGHVGLNKNAAEILFLGRNAPIFQNPIYNPNGAGYDPNNLPKVSDVLGPSAIQISSFNEINFAYGREVYSGLEVKVHAGLGYKYLQGLGALDLTVKDGQVRAYSALAPVFGVNYGALENDPEFNKQTGSKFKPVGSGHGFDIGLAAEAFKIMRFGLAVTDIGSITWEGNLVVANDQPVQMVTSEGISTFNFFDQASTIIGVGNNDLLDYEPRAKRTDKLPTRLRFGAGAKVSEKIEVGLDYTHPLNDQAGNIPSPFFGIGGDFTAGIFKLSTGVSAGAGHGFAVPLGIGLVTPVWEMGIASRDFIGLIADQNPYYSIGFGFLRFKIPQPI